MIIVVLGILIGMMAFQILQMKKIVQPSVEIDFFAKLQCWRNLTHRQRDLYVSKYLGYIVMPDGQVLAPDGSMKNDIPPISQEKRLVAETAMLLAKDDDTDLLFYLLYSRDVMQKWNGRVD